LAVGGWCSNKQLWLQVANTICAPTVTEALPAASIDPPTLAMTFCPNDSPMAGKVGAAFQKL